MLQWLKKYLIWFVMGGYEFITWALKDEWSIHSRIIDSAQASTLEVNMPIWAILVMLIFALTCVSVFDWYKERKVRRKNAVRHLTGDIAHVLHRFQQLPDGDSYTLADVQVMIGSNVGSARALIAEMLSLNLIQETDDCFVEPIKEYVITYDGALVAGA